MYFLLGLVFGKKVGPRLDPFVPDPPCYVKAFAFITGNAGHRDMHGFPLPGFRNK